MVIYKFGGASVKNEDAFQYLKKIVSNCADPLIVVVSAMGKTTNRLEEIVKLSFRGDDLYKLKLTSLKDYHEDIASKLFNNTLNEVLIEIDKLFGEIEATIEKHKNGEFNFFYDQVVTMGEILSTQLVSHYLLQEGTPNEWVDIRKLLKTDENYRDATVDIPASTVNIKEIFSPEIVKCFVTQGFIGSDLNGQVTSLGREGSDYTAALLANIMDVQKVILWKDVAGIFNADPALEKDATLLKDIPYQEMIELAFYGAKVIHPKTIKPLSIKQIPLEVKSFFDESKPGTTVWGFPDSRRMIPVTIVKDKQVLISISLSDLSFISEHHLSKLFELLNRFRLKANLMQHSAVSFSICVDEPRGREVDELIAILREEFKVLYNDKLTLITIRHYTDESIDQKVGGKKIYVEQRNRNTVQYLVA